MNSPFSRSIAWTIWLLASIFYAYQYILRVMPNILLNDIMEQFGIDAATFGQFSGVYYIGYSLLHLPVGIMLDRLGPKKIMSGSILLTMIGLSPLVFSSYWLLPIIGRFLIGVGSSAAILGIFKIIRMAFIEEKFARMLSFSVMIGLLGAIYGGGPVNYMLDTYGYESVVYTFALLGILLAAITYWIVPSASKVEQGSPLQELKKVLKNQKVVLSSVFAGLMVGPLEGFADVWGTAFLKGIYRLDSNVAASLPSIIFVGMCFGAPVLNFLAEKIRSYFLTIVTAGLSMVISFALLLKFTFSTGLIGLNFLIIGIASAYQILAIYKVSTYAAKESAGMTTAVANMIIMVFGYVFHSAIGSVVDSLGGPTSEKALSFGIAVIPSGLLLGVMGFVVLWSQERKPLTQKV